MAQAQSTNFIDPEILNSIDNLELRARVIVEGFLSGLHRSPKRGFSVEFRDYRHYQRGDDMRHVDWKLYGRSDRMYIKQYEDETNLRCHILLDCSASMAYRSSGMSKFEYGRTLAAALAFMLMRQRDAVGLVTFDTQTRERLPAQGRQPHLLRILRNLSQLQPGSRTNIVKPLQELAATLSRRGVVILISDLLDDEQGAIGALKQLRAMGHEVIVFHVMDAQELNFNFEESSEFIDMETDDRHVTSPAAIRNVYLENLGRYLDYCRSECQKAAVDYCLLNTAEPLDRALYAYMTRRGHQ